MKVLVTGSTGFIGSHLVEELLEKKYQVHCLIRKTSNTRWIKDLKVNFVEGSYFDEESLARAVKDMTYVFHVGAMIDALEWDTYYKANVEATVNLLKACATVNPGLKKFIFVSSIAAAGPAKNKKPLKEDDPCNPVSLYGKSKYQAEKEASKFFDQLPVVILRPTNVLGIRQKQLLATLKMARMRIIPLLGTGEKQTSLCFVQDVVQALILAAENKKVRGRAYFVTDGKAYSWREVLNVITSELDLSFVIKIPYPLLMAVAFFAETFAKITRGIPLVTRRSIKSTRTHFWLHDITRIKQELGFSPRMRLEEGLRDIINWYRANRLL